MAMFVGCNAGWEMEFDVWEDCTNGLQQALHLNPLIRQLFFIAIP